MRGVWFLFPGQLSHIALRRNPRRTPRQGMACWGASRGRSNRNALLTVTLLFPPPMVDVWSNNVHSPSPSRSFGITKSGTTPARYGDHRSTRDKVHCLACYPLLNIYAFPKCLFFSSKQTKALILSLATAPEAFNKLVRHSGTSRKCSEAAKRSPASLGCGTAFYAALARNRNRRGHHSDWPWSPAMI
ncbi:hypothetical protein LZ32DRAFT_78575 [Colletotrichum eremochloae]|nr:hypothetical protein LZ32DRAFT_78575 [Colletotrichum eremochloae]